MTYSDEIKLLRKKIDILKQPNFFLDHLRIEEFGDCAGYDSNFRYLVYRSSLEDPDYCNKNLLFDNSLYNKLFISSQGYLSRILETYGARTELTLHFISKKFDINSFLIDSLLGIIQKYHKEFNFDTFNFIGELFSDINSDIKSIYLEFDFAGLRYKINSFDFDENIAYVTLTQISGLSGIAEKFDDFLSGYEHIRQINSKVIEIPDYFMHNCDDENSLKFIVNGIGPNVFDNLYDTEEIVLPPSLIDLKANFWNCKSLKSIKCDSNNYKDLDGVLYTSDYKELIAYPNNKSTFYDIPEGVEVIEKDAFKSCDNIEAIRIPTTLKLIRVNAFYRCPNLKVLALKSEDQSLHIEENSGRYGTNKMEIYIACNNK